MSIDVFISFSSGDKALTERIYDRLRKYGITPWMSSRDISPGSDYQQSIVEAIHEAAIVLLVFSSRANKSAEIVKELSLASTKTVIPVRIEDVLPEGAFLYQMSNRQFYDLFGDFDRRLDELCEMIRDVVQKRGGQERVPLPRAKPSGGRKGVPLVITGIAVCALAGGGYYAFMHHGPTASAAPAAASAPIMPKAPAVAAVPLAPAVKAVQSSSLVAAPTAAPAARDGSSATTQTASSTTLSGQPDAATQAFVSLLAGQSGFTRLQSIRAMSTRIPSPLTAADAAAILDGTQDHRNDAIRELLPHLVGNLSGFEAVQIVGDQVDFPRFSAISSLAGSLRGDLSAAEAVALLNHTQSHRVDALRSIIDHVGRLDAKGATDILARLQGFPRSQAINLLKMKLPENLSGAEVAALLDGTQANRADAVKSMADHVATLDAGGVVAILGDLQGFQRFTALQSLTQTGRIAHGLNEAGVQQILGNMPDNKNQAMGLLAPYMH